MVRSPLSSTAGSRLPTRLPMTDPAGAESGIGMTYREVFRAAPDGIVLVDSRGVIQDANPQITRMFGYAREDLVGRMVEILVPLESRRRHERMRRGFGRSAQVRPMGSGMELRGLRKDGTEFPVEISLSPIGERVTSGVVAILRDLSEQRRMQALMSGTLQAVESERSRIAHELHDDTAQKLAAVLLALQRVARMSDEDQRQRLCLGLRDDLVEIAESVRRIARGLRPPELERMGVVAAVRTWVEGQLDDHDLDGRLHIDEVDGMLHGSAKLVLYRVVQEALANALRHAAPTRVDVTVRDEGGVVVATVDDDGCGFNVAGARRDGPGLGLLGMRERAAMVGALLSIASTPGQGTVVRLAIPTIGTEP